MFLFILGDCRRIKKPNFEFRKDVKRIKDSFLNDNLSIKLYKIYN